MFSKSRQAIILGLLSSVCLYGGGWLLAPVIYGGLAHDATNFLLFFGKIVLGVLLIFSGIFLLLRSNQANGSSVERYSSNDFNAQEVLQYLQAKTLPTGWNVFHAARKKTLVQGSFMSLLLLPALLLFSAMAWWGPTTPPSLFDKYAVYLPLVVVLAMIYLPFSSWRASKDLVLLVNLEGFISGHRKKPQRTLHLKFRDIADIRVLGNTIIVRAKNEKEEKRIDCSLFVEPINEIAAPLLAAFVAYKAEHPDGLLTSAPIFVSRFNRQRAHPGDFSA